MEVKKKYNVLFEGFANQGVEDLIYVKYQDLDGFIHFEYCEDCLQTNHTMTETQLYRDYKRLPNYVPPEEWE